MSRTTIQKPQQKSGELLPEIQKSISYKKLQFKTNEILGFCLISELEDELDLEFIHLEAERLAMSELLLLN